MKQSAPAHYFNTDHHNAVRIAGYAIVASMIGQGFHAVHAISSADFMAGKYIIDKNNEKWYSEGLCETKSNFDWNLFGRFDHLHDAVTENNNPAVDLYKITREGARQDLVISAAGIIAEAKYRDLPLIKVIQDEEGEGSWQTMEAIASFVASDDADHIVLVNEAIVKARELFRNEKTWKAVLDLADLMHQHGTVTGDMAEPITSRLQSAREHALN